MLQAAVKKLYSLSDGGKRILAAQGHSTKQVAIDNMEKAPPLSVSDMANLSCKRLKPYKCNIRDSSFLRRRMGFG
jgi:hypothetical protein